MASITLQENGKFRASLCVARKRTTKVFDTESEARAWAQRIEGLERLNARRERGSREARLLSLVPSRVLDAMGEVPYDAEQIVANAFPYGVESGIYFLIKEGGVIYVGQSVNVLDRIGKHRREGKWFDSFNILLCPREKLDELERAYILALMPKMNTSLVGRKKTMHTAMHTLRQVIDS